MAVVVEVSVAQYSRNLGSRPSCTLEVASEGTTLSSLEALIETEYCKDDIAALPRDGGGGADVARVPGRHARLPGHGAPPPGAGRGRRGGGLVADRARGQRRGRGGARYVEYLRPPAAARPDEKVCPPCNSLHCPDPT